MKYIFAMAGLLLTGLVFSSCEKHAGDIAEPIPSSSIQFTSPLPGMVKQLGDSVWIRAKAISTETIHGCDLVIRKANDTTVYFATHLHDHNDTIQVNQLWVNDQRGPLDLEATLTIYLDHDGHTNTGKIPFKIL